MTRKITEVKGERQVSRKDAKSAKEKRNSDTNFPRTKNAEGE
jgi:hypothetical protein